MAGKLHFTLVAPERQLFSGEVDQVDAAGVEGDFGVLAGHAPYVATLRPGILTIFGDGSQRQSSLVDVLIGAGKRLLTGAGLFMTVFMNTRQGKKRVSFAAPFAAFSPLAGRMAGALDDAERTAITHSPA